MTGSANFRETSPKVGDTLHADFTWSGGESPDYAAMAILNPDGNIVSFHQATTSSGSYTLTATATVPGWWYAYITVFKGGGNEQYEDAILVSTGAWTFDTCTCAHQPSCPANRPTEQETFEIDEEVYVWSRTDWSGHNFTGQILSWKWYHKGIKRWESSWTIPNNWNHIYCLWWKIGQSYGPGSGYIEWYLDGEYLGETLTYHVVCPDCNDARLNQQTWCEYCDCYWYNNSCHSIPQGTSGEVWFTETTPYMGEKLHANYSWTGAHKDGTYYVYCYLYDPTGNPVASYYEPSLPDGSHTIEYIADRTGTWRAELIVWYYYDKIQYNAYVDVTIKPIYTRILGDSVFHEGPFTPGENALLAELDIENAGTQPADVHMLAVFYPGETKEEMKDYQTVYLPNESGTFIDWYATMPNISGQLPVAVTIWGANAEYNEGRLPWDLADRYAWTLHDYDGDGGNAIYFPAEVFNYGSNDPEVLLRPITPITQAWQKDEAGNWQSWIRDRDPSFNTLTINSVNPCYINFTEKCMITIYK